MMWLPRLALTNGKYGVSDTVYAGSEQGSRVGIETELRKD